MAEKGRNLLLKGFVTVQVLGDYTISRRPTFKSRRSLAKELSPKSRLNRSRFLVVQVQILRLSMSRNLGGCEHFFSALVYSPPMIWFG